MTVCCVTSGLRFYPAPRSAPWSDGEAETSLVFCATRSLSTHLGHRLKYSAMRHERSRWDSRTIAARALD